MTQQIIPPGEKLSDHVGTPYFAAACDDGLHLIIGSAQVADEGSFYLMSLLVAMPNGQHIITLQMNADDLDAIELTVQALMALSGRPWGVFSPELVNEL